jgi:Iron-containing alcohol dehydrogenase
MSAPTARQFTYDALPGRVVFGAGAGRRLLAAEVERLGASRLLLIATQQERPARRGALDGSRRPRRRRVHRRPPARARRGCRRADVARKARADALLSIGGGSTTGTAKAVALETALPVIAVPTTYAGSEVTPVWGMTEGRRKTTGTAAGSAAGRRLRPRPRGHAAAGDHRSERDERDRPLRRGVLCPRREPDHGPRRGGGNPGARRRRARRGGATGGSERPQRDPVRHLPRRRRVRRGRLAAASQGMPRARRRVRPAACRPENGRAAAGWWRSRRRRYRT